MAAIEFDATPLLPALRKMISSMNFSDEFRDILLTAVEDCARRSHNAKAAVAARKLYAVKPRRAARTEYQRQYMRAWRARKKATQS
jgi:hypothetical protein